MDECLGIFVQVPLQVAAKSRAVIQHSHKLSGGVLARRQQHTARAFMKIRMPERMDMLDLEAADLTRNEVIIDAGAAAFSPSPSRFKQTVLFHEPRDRGVRRQRFQLLVLFGDRDEIVVVQLVGPARMLFVQSSERLLDRHRHRGMTAGVRRYFARQRPHRVVRMFLSQIQPPLDG
jgi:hypothetical protein